MSVLALVLAGAPLVAPAPLSTQDAERCCELYPAASGPLEIQLGDGESLPSLRDLAVQYASLAGVHLVFDDATAARLAQGPGGLQASVSVPAREVQSFFEQLLAANGFVLESVRDDAPRMARILALDQMGPLGVPRARIVPAERVQHYAKHPATMVATTLHLPSSDVRQLATSVRALLVDGRTQTVVPAGTSDSMVISGLGARVADLARILTQIDEAAQAPASARQVEIVEVRHAHAVELALVLRQAFTPPRSGDGGEILPPSSRAPRFVVDERTNSLLITGSADDLRAARETIATLDVPAKGSSDR